MNVAIKFAAMQLKSQMQYKVSFFLTLFGQFITAFTTFFGLRFLLECTGAIDGFTEGQVLLCYAVIMASFSLGELFGAGFAVFPRLLGDGSFDRILVRPRGLLVQMLFQNLDFSRLGLTAQASVTLAYAIPRSGITWTAERVALLALMVLCGSGVFFGLFLLQASFAFFTTRSLQFLNIFTYGARSFGRYPFSVYGNPVPRLLTFVVPLALLFLIPCFALFRFGLSRHKSTGS